MSRSGILRSAGFKTNGQVVMDLPLLNIIEQLLLLVKKKGGVGDRTQVPMIRVIL